jgi:hypothetical protein
VGKDLLGWRNIQDAVSESSKGNARVAHITLVGEHDLHDRDVMDDWRRDGGDQQQDGSCEQEEGADMVEDSCLAHFD